MSFEKEIEQIPYSEIKTLGKELKEAIEEIRKEITQSMAYYTNYSNLELNQKEKEIKKLIDNLKIVNDIEYLYKLKDDEFEKLYHKTLDYIKKISNDEDNMKISLEIMENITLHGRYWKQSINLMILAAFFTQYPERFITKKTCMLPELVDKYIIINNISYGLDFERTDILEVSQYFQKGNSFILNNYDSNPMLKELKNSEFSHILINIQLKEKRKVERSPFSLFFYDLINIII